MSVDVQPFDGPVRTELDSHANMVVLGSNVLILSTTLRTAMVRPFTPDYEALPDVPIVDAALLYECSFTGRKCILICFNALSIPTMRNNLIPPFVMREAGLIVNNVPKIQLSDP